MDIATIKFRARQDLDGKLFSNSWLMATLAFFIYSAIIGAASGLLPGIATVILTGPLTYGYFYLLLRQSREKNGIEIGDLFKGFSDQFGQTLLLGLLISVFTFLWSLLFVIPGIVKGYSYSMAYYIKVDHPDYDWQDCINGSKEMMDGHKWDLFVLDLSFIGWYILGALCCGIGTFFVYPYHLSARTEFYKDLIGESSVTYEA